MSGVLKGARLVLLGGRRASDPSSLSLDFSALPDGALPGSWLNGGGAWSIASGKAVNTPEYGAELLPNPGLEAAYAAGLANNWTKNGTPTVTEETTLIHGGASSQKIVTGGSNQGVYKYLVPDLGKWFSITAWTYFATGGGTCGVSASGNNLLYARNMTASAEWQQTKFAFRNTINGYGPYARSYTASATTMYLDDASVRQITTATMFRTKRFTGNNPAIEAALTFPANLSAGVVFCLDSETNPQNFILAYHDGTNAHLDKCVAGTYTALLSVAATYGAGYKIKAIKDGTAVSLYYNNVQIGATQTIEDAGIISNTLHGLFVSDPLVQVGSFICRTSPMVEVANVLIIGDSKSTASYTWFEQTTDTYLGYCLQALPTRIATSGWNTADAKAAIDAALAAATGTPEIVFINLGANDTYAGGIVPTEANYKADTTYIIDALRTKWAGVTVYLDHTWERTTDPHSETLRTWRNAVIATYASGVYAGLDENVWMKGSDDGATYSSDGTHYSAAGSTRKAELLRALIA